MFGKTYIMSKEMSFTDLEPGTPDWMIYWAAYPEQQGAMLAWQRSRKVTINAHAESDSIAVIDANDTVIAFSPEDRVHSVWPFLKHRRSHVITLSPNRQEVVLLKEDGWDWIAPTRHVHAQESYFSCAERALIEKLGLETILRGRLREIHYEQKAEGANDYEATTVYEYTIPNLTEITANSKLTSVDIRELLQAKETTPIGGLFWRLFTEVVSNGELKWRQ